MRRITTRSWRWISTTTTNGTFPCDHGGHPCPRRSPLLRRTIDLIMDLISCTPSRWMTLQHCLRASPCHPWRHQQQHARSAWTDGRRGSTPRSCLSQTSSARGFLDSQLRWRDLDGVRAYFSYSSSTRSTSTPDFCCSDCTSHTRRRSRIPTSGTPYWVRGGGRLSPSRCTRTSSSCSATMRRCLRKACRAYSQRLSCACRTLGSSSRCAFSRSFS
mmetsp:Transcript_8690/g.23311  ORF Transcript_8690/g.23311 Transcript_8690/m.23311 type:complete len:216 (+) Transcript_8690:184-831(+)